MMVDSASALVGGISVKSMRKVGHEGNHATIWAGTTDGMRVIVKEHSFRSKTSDELIRDWKTYRKQIDSLASETQIRSLPTLSFEIDDKRRRIRFVDQMAENSDVSYLIKQAGPGNEKMALLAKLLCSFCAIPYDDKYRTEYMLDGEFSNFCPNSTGGFDYVDLFPAHMRQASTGLLEANDEHQAGTRSLALETFLTGDIYGVVGRFWGMLRRDQPTLWRLAPADPAIQQALMSIPPELKSYSEHLFKTDTAFIQGVYGCGLRDTKSMYLHEVLTEWKSRDHTLPPEL
jgi:hypothetical protein